MSIEGQLEDVSLADICQLLAMGRKTGCLTVTDRSAFGYVYFDGGRVVYANLLNRPDRLGELLVRSSVIDREELSQAMEQQAREPGRRLGEILVSRGSLTEDELRRHITIQIEEAVYHLFAWERGSFHFAPDETPDDEGMAGVSINAESLLLEGARRVDEWSLIEKKIPSMDLVFGLERNPRAEGTGANGEPLELTREQEKILPLIDGERSVEELAAAAGMVDFDAAKALFGLVQAGFATRTGRKEVRRSSAEEAGSVRQHLDLASAYYRAGMLEDAAREYGAVLEIDERQGRARARLALIALKEGKPEAALDHYGAAPEVVRENWAGLRNRAYALELLGRPDEALSLLDRAAELRSGDPELMLARAILLLKARRARRASEVFRRYRAGLDKGALPPPMYYAYGVLAAAAAGDPDDALGLGREGLGNYPGEGPILVNLGVVLEAQGEASAAEALFLRAVSEPPAPPQGHKNLGDLAYRRGDQAGARAHYERAVRIDPELGDDVYLKLGNIAYKEGDRDWARQLWTRALELDPGNEVVRTNLELVSSTPDR